MDFDDVTAWIIRERTRLNTLYHSIMARPKPRGGMLDLDLRVWLLDMRLYLARIHDLISSQ